MLSVNNDPWRIRNNVDPKFNLCVCRGQGALEGTWYLSGTLKLPYNFYSKTRQVTRVSVSTHNLETHFVGHEGIHRSNELEINTGEHYIRCLQFGFEASRNAFGLTQFPYQHA